jgi:DNA repair exonuclease SbcCD ATPase subunit
MSKSKSGNDIQAVVYEACEAMLRAETQINNITGRKVAAQDGVSWSHTTVTPFVRRWHSLLADKERKAIEQTKMSQNFVRALHKEVEERVVALRGIDSEQIQMLQNELQDMIGTNVNIEHELTDAKEKLAKKTEEASQASALAEQCQKDKSKADSDHKDAISTLQYHYNQDLKELKENIESNQLKYIAERTELKKENKDAIQILTEKKDEIYSDLKEKSAECAEAKVKADNFEKASVALEYEKNKSTKLTEQIIRLKSDLEIKQHTLISAEQTTTDCKTQRDKAQLAREVAELELKKLHLSHQKILVKAASAGVTLDTKNETE